jgi:hypothetical protein
MEAKPRLPMSHNAAKSKGHLLQARVMPGRHDAAIGSGGERFNAKPASASHAPSSSRQRHASGCHEAGHDGTEKRIGFATTIHKATKREPAANNNPQVPSAAKASRRCVEMDNTKASPEGQSARAGAQQNEKTQQIHDAAPLSQMPRSKT